MVFESGRVHVNNNYIFSSYNVTEKQKLYKNTLINIQGKSIFYNPLINDKFMFMPGIMTEINIFGALDSIIE